MRLGGRMSSGKERIVSAALRLAARAAPHVFGRATALASRLAPAAITRHTLEHLRTAPPDRDDLLHFLAFAAPLAARSRAQLFQDLWALWESGGRRDGYFVEFGALDGIRLSNTWLLESMGWTGVVAEPNPAFASALAANRRCHVSHACVFSRTGETLPFIAAAEGEYSRIASIADERGAPQGQIMVPTISLDDLLREVGAPAEIDFFSVDTEGSEYEILSAFPFERWSIKAISVEHNYGPTRARLLDLLTANGFRRKWPELSLWDDWYVRG